MAKSALSLGESPDRSGLHAEQVAAGDVLNQVVLTVNSSLELKEILKELGRLTLEAIPADRCHLFLLDDSKSKLIPTFSEGRVTDLALWQRFKTIEPIDLHGVPERWKTITDGRALSIIDMAVSPIVPSEFVEIFKSRSAILVPLESAGEPLGLFAVDWVVARQEIDYEYVELAEAIGAHAALAIRNARLHDRLAGLRRQLQKVDALYRLSDIVAGTADLPAALRRLNKALRPQAGIRVTSAAISNAKVREAVGAKAPDPQEMAAIRSWRALLRGSAPVRPRPAGPAGDAVLVPIVRGKAVNGALRVALDDPALLDDGDLLMAIGGACAEIVYKASLQRELMDSRLRLTVAAERDRIAQDLHDSVVQVLRGLSIELKACADKAPNQEWKTRLTQMHRLANRGMSEVRESIHSLLFLQVRRKGLERSLKGLAGKFSATTGIDTDFTVRGEVTALPASHEDALFRVAHEALMNVEHHSRASFASIILTYTKDEVSVRVRDDGVGLVHRKPSAKRDLHFGLMGIRRLVHEAGGRLEVRNASPRGVFVESRLPNRPNRRGHKKR
jgi:signal transduction histidine kinase